MTCSVGRATQKYKSSSGSGSGGDSSLQDVTENGNTTTQSLETSAFFLGDGSLLSGTVLLTDFNSNVARVVDLETAVINQTANITSNVSKIAVLETSVINQTANITSNVIKIAALENSTIISNSSGITTEFTKGDILYASANGTLAKLPISTTTGHLLTVTSSSNKTLAWRPPVFTSDDAVVGTLQQVTTSGSNTDNFIEFENATTGVRVLSNILVDSNVTAGFFHGDGSNLTAVVLPADLIGLETAVSNLQSSNTDIWSNLTSNVGRISSLEFKSIGHTANIASNVERIVNLEYSNVNMWSNLASNVERISSLEFKSTGHTVNIASNANEIRLLDIVVADQKTNITDNVERIVNLEYSNVDIWSNLASNVERISSLDFKSTGHTANIASNANEIRLLDIIVAGQISNITDNVERIANLEYSNVDIWSNLASNVERISTLENTSMINHTPNITDNSSRITTLESSTTIISNSSGITTGFTKGDIIYASENNTLDKLEICGCGVAVGYVLTVTSIENRTLGWQPQSDASDDAAVGSLQQVTTSGSTTDNFVQFTNATTGVRVLSNILVDSNVTAGFFHGDGSNLTAVVHPADLTILATAVSNLQSSNTDIWSNLTSNVTKIFNLQTAVSNLQSSNTDIWSDLTSNVSKIVSLETAVSNLQSSNTGIWSSLAANVVRIGNIETSDTEQTNKIAALENSSIITSSSGITTGFAKGDILYAAANNRLEKLSISGGIGHVLTITSLVNQTLGWQPQSESSGGGAGGTIGNLQQVTTSGSATSEYVQFTNATTGVRVHSNILVDSNVTAGFFHGDGSNLTAVVHPADLTILETAVSNLQSSNAGIWTSLESNVSKISVLETHDGINTIDIAALLSNLNSNVVRIGELETHDSINTIDIAALLSNLNSNVVRIGELETYDIAGILSNLNSNVVRIGELEDATGSTIDNYVTSGTNTGISNINPQHTLDIGSNVRVDDTGVDVVAVSGNVAVTGNIFITQQVHTQSLFTTTMFVKNTVIIAERLSRQVYF
jgi:hypothetical protein